MLFQLYVNICAHKDEGLFSVLEVKA